MSIGILRGTNPRNPFALYIGEILAIEGLPYQFVTGSFDGEVLIVPDLALTPAQRDFVWQWAGASKGLLALRPGRELWPLFGLTGREDYVFTWADRYLRLSDGTLLQYHGPADLLRAPEAEVLAWLQCACRGAPSEHPALVRCEDGGRRAAFTFDLARSTVLFHQGRSDQAGDGPNPDPDGDGGFKPNDLFVNYLDPRLKEIPQADVYQTLLVQLLDWLTEKTTPLPRLWRFPQGQPALAFLTGDSDGAPAEELHLAFDLAEQRGLKYTLYLMTRDFPQLPPPEVAALRERGHSVGLHPWADLTPRVAEFRRHLRQEYAGFQERYGYLPATTRHHCCIVAGWTETQETAAELGVRMDLNFYSARGFQWGFLNGSALPVKFCRRDGRLIDCYSQCTLTSDDCMLEDKTLLPVHTVDEAITLTLRLLDDLRTRWQGVYQPCFHPLRLRQAPPPTQVWYEATLDALREREFLSVSGEEWVAFNEARRAVRLTRQGEGWQLYAPQAIQGLTILFPARVERVAVNGQSQPLQPVKWNGVAAKWFVVDAAAGETLRLTVR
ncbi:MAG TPA: hypothetical protein EYP85_11125 [Armatimonadetes bacterium]|nr:hypothetical protein [Armatimonadota bacterium]